MRGVRRSILCRVSGGMKRVCFKSINFQQSNNIQNYDIEQTSSTGKTTHITDERGHRVRVCMCVEGGGSEWVGGREGLLALSFLRIWLEIKVYTDIHGVRAARLRPVRHEIAVQITARKRHFP
jgi:hypothetical protein